jgi:4-amino-4-deoxy-L-arabinose transferase-like glycosyltransferase
VRLWFASRGLNEGRFFDERYILENVYRFFTQGSLRPVHMFYPQLGTLLHTLLLGTADALARWTGQGSETILRQQQFTPTAYLLSRGLQVCIGVLSIYWTWRLGRRLLSPRAGLLAALALSAVPMHVRQSAVIKPDILLLLALLIAAEATVAALASGRLRELLGVGAAVGLAAASKYNGVAAALPLALFALPRARREPAILARLVAAGVVSLLVFVLLNPFFFSMQERFNHDFSHILEHYQVQSRHNALERSHLAVLWATPSVMSSAMYHGLFTGLLGFAGLLFVLGWAWRRRDDRSSQGLALLAVLPISYLALYAAMTTYPKTNNFLPLCPFLALGAAALVSAAWGRLHGPAARVFAVAAVLWCATLIWRPMAYAYTETAPTTLATAESTLSTELSVRGNSRIVYQVGAVGRPMVVDLRGEALVRVVTGIDQTTPQALDLADAEVFTPAALASPAAAQRVAAAAAAQQQVLRIEPRLFHSRGEPLTLVLHPWSPVGRPVELAMLPPGAGGAWTARLPAHLAESLRFPALASFEVIVSGGSRPEAVAVGSQRLPLFSGARRGRRWLTERVRLAQPPEEIALPGLPADAPRPRLRLLLWGER